MLREKFIRVSNLLKFCPIKTEITVEIQCLSEIFRNLESSVVKATMPFLLENRELNHLRMNHRFEKIVLFHSMNFRYHFTYNLSGAWYTLYAMLF